MTGIISNIHLAKLYLGIRSILPTFFIGSSVISAMLIEGL
jgi:hypothetical protein